MKILPFLLLICFISRSSAQSGYSFTPEADIALSSYSNLHPRIVADRTGNPLVLWGKFSTNEIYFSRWSNGNFTTPVVLNPPSMPSFVASWAGPEIATYGDTVYVVFKQTPEDTNHIFLLRSFDGGVSFSAPVQVDHLTDSASRFPAVTVDSIGNPIVAYMKFEQGFINASYVVARSNDFGNTFSNDVLASGYLGENVCDCCPAALVSSGNLGAMLYRTNLNDFRTIWCGVSNDNCETFPFGMQVDQTGWLINACPSSGPDGFILGDSVYTVFMSGQSGDAKCYISAASMSNYGAGPPVPLTDSSAQVTNQNFPRVAHSGNRAGVVCRQTDNFAGQLAFFYTNDIHSGLPQIFDTLGQGNITNGDVVLTDDAVHVVWQDDNSETVKYRKGTISTTNIKEMASGDVVLYPSPSTGTFFLHVKTNEPIVAVNLFDVLGKKATVSWTQNAAEISCDAGRINPGIYMVQLTTATSDVIAKRLLIK